MATSLAAQLQEHRKVKGVAFFDEDVRKIVETLEDYNLLEFVDEMSDFFSHIRIYIEAKRSALEECISKISF